MKTAKMTVACLLFSSLAGSAYSAEPPANAAQANNPQANMTAFNMQNYYIGDVSEVTKTPTSSGSATPSLSRWVKANGCFAPRFL